MCFSAHEQHPAKACKKPKKKQQQKKSCTYTKGAPLAVGLPGAEDTGNADSRTASAGGGQCFALWSLSFLAWERMSGIRYNGIEVAAQGRPVHFW